MAIGQAELPRTLPPLKSNKTIGLISDTHVPSRAKAIPASVYSAFENVDYIIHAGDLVDFSVLEELEQVAPVLAVCGNMDNPQVREVLPSLNSLKIFDWKIGVTHEPGALYGLGKMREFEGDWNPVPKT